jgi:hypothetical protein
MQKTTTAFSDNGLAQVTRQPYLGGFVAYEF